MSVKIFFCYAREDEALLNELKTHLKPLQRQGLIQMWHDREISAGTEWKREINKHLNSAQIILLLISPDFMASDYCYGIEMKQALKRHKRGEAQVIPIILRPVYWQGQPFSKLQALPTDGKPVTDPAWYNLDRAFFNIANGIYKAIGKLNQFTLKHTLRVYEEKVSGRVCSIAFSPDGQYLVSGGSDGTITVWDLPTRKRLRIIKRPLNGVSSIAFSSDGQTFICVNGWSKIELLNFYSGALLETLKEQKSFIGTVAISSDGQYLAGGISGEDIMVWDLRTGKLLCAIIERKVEILMSPNIPSDVAISSDGQYLAASRHSDIRVWNLHTTELLLAMPSSEVSSIAFSSDGQYLVSGSSDGTITVWSLHVNELFYTNELLYTLKKPSSDVSSIIFSRDGQTLATSTDRMIYIWGRDKAI